MRINSLQRLFLLTGAAIVGTSMVSSTAQAQLTIANSGLADQEIPLAGSVTIGADGKVTATCSGAICETLGQGSTAIQPVVTFTNPATNVTLDANVTTLANATASATASAAGNLVCRYTASTGVTGWAGLAEMARTSGSGTRSSSVTFPANTTTANISYDLTAQCGLPQSTGGWSPVVTRTITVPPGSGGGGGSATFGNCEISNPATGQLVTLDDGNRTNWPSGFTNVRPVGFTPYNRAWENQWGQAFDIRDTIPSTLGAFSVSANDSRGMYITMPFTVPDRSGQWRVTWDLAQPNGADNYSFARTANPVHVTVSPCAGDVRPRDTGTSDNWTRYCRWTVATGQIIFNSRNEAGCKVERNKTYWLTIMMADPRRTDLTGEELLTTEETCTGGNVACETAFWYDLE